MCRFSSLCGGVEKLVGDCEKRLDVPNFCVVIDWKRSQIRCNERAVMISFYLQEEYVKIFVTTVDKC